MEATRYAHIEPGVPVMLWKRLHLLDNAVLNLCELSYGEMISWAVLVDLIRRRRLGTGALSQIGG